MCTVTENPLKNIHLYPDGNARNGKERKMMPTRSMAQKRVIYLLCGDCQVENRRDNKSPNVERVVNSFVAISQ